MAVTSITNLTAARFMFSMPLELAGYEFAVVNGYVLTASQLSDLSTILANIEPGLTDNNPTVTVLGSNISIDSTVVAGATYNNLTFSAVLIRDEPFTQYFAVVSIEDMVIATLNNTETLDTMHDYDLEVVQ